MFLFPIYTWVCNNIFPIFKIFSHGITCNIFTTGETYIIRVTAAARHVGSFHAPLAFHFRKTESGKDFHIIRFIHAKCKNQVTDQLGATRKYKRPPRVTWKKNAKEIVPGVPLPR